MVGVDQPMKALFMHIQKPYKGKLSKVLIAVILSKIIFSELNSFMHMFNVYTLYRQSIKGPPTVSYSICPNFDSLWLG